MKFATSKMGVTRFDDAAAYADYSVAVNPSSLDVFLVEIEAMQPYSLTKHGAQTKVRFSQGNDGRPYNASAWVEAAEIAVQRSSSLYQSEDFFGDPGGSSQTFGSIDIAWASDPNNQLTRFSGTTTDRRDITRFSFDGRPMFVRAGKLGDDYGSFVDVYHGSCLGVEFDQDVFSFLPRDYSDLLNVTICPTFAGTGGLEGGSDLKGQAKAVIYGAPQFFSPRLIDTASGSPVYDVGSGRAPIQAVTMVTARLASPYWISDGDVGDVYAWTPVSGHYVTDLANGVIRLGDPPNDPLIVSVQGSSSPSYVTTIADIIQDIVTKTTGFSASDLDLGSFNKFNTNTSYAISVIFNDQSATVGQAVDLLLSQARGWRIWARTNKLRIGQISLASIGQDGFTSVASVVASKPVITKFVRPIKRLQTPAALGDILIGANRCWNPLTADRIAASATDADKLFVLSEYRYPLSSSSFVFNSARHLNKRPELIGSLLDSTTDAATEEGMRGGFFATSASRMFWQIDVADAAFAYEPGDIVILKDDRFFVDPTLFPSGTPAIVYSVTERSDSRTATLRVLT